MADAKITALSADTSPTTDDLLITVNDPGGTPANKKVTIANLLTLVPSVLFSVTKGGTNQTGIADQTLTLLTWSTERWDVGGYFASNKFTPLVAGKYRAMCQVYINSGVTIGSNVILRFRMNGDSATDQDVLLVAPATGLFSVQGAADFAMNGSTDYLEVYIYGITVTTIVVLGAASVTHFEGTLIS